MANKTLFWSFFVVFCAFCASLRLKRTVFRWLLKKAVSMALRTKATLCVKSSLLEQSLPRTPSRPKTSIISVNPVILSNFSSCSSCFRGEKIREISVNPWLINDLRLFKALYNCREDSTTIESSLQISSFTQNKANFPKSQMNVSRVSTRDYDKKTLGQRGKNKPKTNPIQSQSNPISEKAKMNVTSIIAKGYENKPRFRAKAKQTQYKPNSNPNKPNFKGGIIIKKMNIEVEVEVADPASF